MDEKNNIKSIEMLLEALENCKSDFIDNSGFIYFMLNETTGLVKIGRTINLNKRKRDIETQSGNSINILFSAYVKNMFSAETFLHRYFKECFVVGEWYDLYKWGLNRLDKLEIFKEEFLAKRLT